MHCFRLQQAASIPQACANSSTLLLSQLSLLFNCSQCCLILTGGFYSPGLDPRHPDLVAYYKFDEGAGYVVKDVTGRGHDLSITQSPPGWQVGWG